MKTESNLFRSGFWLGRLIWVSGPSVKRKFRLRQLLLGCGVLERCQIELTSLQFIDLCSRGFSTSFQFQYEVCVVTGFEQLLGVEAIAFRRAVQTFIGLKLGHLIQLVLASSGPVSGDLQSFSEFEPVQILLEDESDDPGEANERLHKLISMAMKATGVTVRKISERAAAFLEMFLDEEGDDATFVLIYSGLLRTNTWELTLRNLVAENEIEVPIPQESPLDPATT